MRMPLTQKLRFCLTYHCWSFGGRMIGNPVFLLLHFQVTNRTNDGARTNSFWHTIPGKSNGWFPKGSEL